MSSSCNVQRTPTCPPPTSQQFGLLLSNETKVPTWGKADEFRLRVAKTRGQLVTQILTAWVADRYFCGLRWLFVVSSSSRHDSMHACLTNRCAHHAAQYAKKHHAVLYIMAYGSFSSCFLPGCLPVPSSQSPEDRRFELDSILPVVID